MASEHVSYHLRDITDDIYEEAVWSKKGRLLKERKLLWHKTIKSWNTIYAVCIDKEYNHHNKIVSYTLEDFNGNIMKVEPNKLKVAIALNKIDVINLSLFIEQGKIGKLTDLKMINVKSFEELENTIKNGEYHAHYIIGNKNIGYFEMEGRDRLLDYKGYNKEIRLPSVKSILSNALSFNDYVSIVHIPSTYTMITTNMLYNAKCLTDIYMECNSNQLLDMLLLDYPYICKEYTPLCKRNDVHIHVLDFNMDSPSFFDMLRNRKDLNIHLKITNQQLDIKDPLQAFISKSKMIGSDKFDINYSNRKLMRFNAESDLDVVKLPPVERLNTGWYDDRYFINKLYLPSTLSMGSLKLRHLPHKEICTYNSKTNDYDITYERRVNIVVIPEELKFHSVLEDEDTLGIIFETKYGVGTADNIAVEQHEYGLALKVIEIIKYPDIKLDNGNKKKGIAKVIIEDSAGNRKSVEMSLLVSKILSYSVHLINAELLLNNTIRINNQL